MPKLSKKITIILVTVAGLIISYLLFASWQLFINNNSFAQGTTYYNYDLSNKTPSEAEAYINSQLSGVKITIKDEDVRAEGSLKDFGVEAQVSNLEKSLNNQVKQRAFIPFFFNKGVPSPLTIDPTEYSIYSQQNIQNIENVPINAKYILKDGEIVIQEGKAGQGFDIALVNEPLMESARLQKDNEIETELEQIIPAIDKQILDIVKQSAEQIPINEYKLVGLDKSYTIEPNLVLAYLIPNTYISDVTVRTADAKQIIEEVASKANVPAVDEITTVYKSGKPSAITTQGKAGRIVNNIDKLANELVNAVNTKNDFAGKLAFEDTSFSKKEVAVDDTVRAVNYTYKIITWGTTASNIDDFAAKVAQTLADDRGWSRSGVTFTRVNGASDFDIVLSQPEELPRRYPQWCDSTYSCRVGRYVIINDDRWRLATPSWNNANGSLRDYQHMVVNHEIGHRLGRGHEYCAGTGQLAPVMQQQSIDLQGCKFNPWPLDYEIGLVRNSI